MATDLWPDFRVPPPPSAARRLLNEAGEELWRKTHGRIELQVTPGRAEPPLPPLTYDCELYVPRLHFPFLLARVRTHETGFPARIEWAEGDPKRDIPDADGLRAALAEVFHSDYTTRVVENLMSLDAGPDHDADAA